MSNLRQSWMFGRVSFSRFFARGIAAAFTIAITAGAIAADTDGEWTELRELLGNIKGIATAPPADIVTDKFTTGALLGNGDIGAVAGDTTTTQKFYFSKGDFLGVFPNLSKNRYENAVLPIGSLVISSPETTTETAADAASAYRLEQDILNAEVTTTLKLGDTVVQMRSWLADGDNVFVTEFSSPPRARPVTIRAELQEPQSDAFPASAGVTESLPWITRENDDRTEVKSRVALAMRLIGGVFSSTESKGTAASGSFTLQPGATVTLAVAVHGDTKLTPACRPTEEIRDQALRRVATLTDREIITLEAKHHAWWKDYWLKSYVRVHDDVLEKYYYGALYALGSAARPNKTLPSMWGLWLTTDTPAWGGRHFFNYNAQGPYYGVASSNRPELLLPYSEFVMAELPYQVNLTHAAGYRGTTWKRSFAPIDLFRPQPPSEPVAPEKNYQNLPTDQKSNGGFAVVPMLNYYEYTRDRTFLQTKLYPLLKELDAFWRDFMVKESLAAGSYRYVIRHTGAHEVPVAEDVNPNLDVGYIRMVCRALLDASHELGVDADLVPVWQDVLDHLSAYPTGRYDGKECYQECEVRATGITDPANLMHRMDQPINMEGAVHPGENVTLGGDAHWIEVGLDTYNYMNAWGISGRKMNNGFCKVWPQAVRLGWPADDFLEKFKACIGTLWRESNLTCFQGGGGIETCGSIDAVNCMLLQSNFEELRLFPVWPKTRDAQFHRLRAKGAFVVSSVFAHGSVSFIDVVSEQGRPLTIINPWTTEAIEVYEMRADARVPLRPQVEDGKITLPTEPGKRYLVQPTPKT
jgi:hypothetical protein